MRTQDPSADFQDGIEPAPMPPQAPDGGLDLPPIRPVLPPRPRLCEAGPCKHYHRLAVQMDAAQPHTRRIPIVLPDGTPGAQPVTGGTVYTSPPGYHVQVSHYCYPEVGIEMPLGDMPVTQCNRWAPLGPQRAADGTRVSMSPADFFRTSLGQTFRADVQAWEHARAEEAAKDEEAERLIAESMNITDPRETP